MVIKVVIRGELRAVLMHHKAVIKVVPHRRFRAIIHKKMER